jgi:hypothetical protein
MGRGGGLCNHRDGMKPLRALCTKKKEKKERTTESGITTVAETRPLFQTADGITVPYSS